MLTRRRRAGALALALGLAVVAVAAAACSPDESTKCREVAGEVEDLVDGITADAGALGEDPPEAEVDELRTRIGLDAYQVEIQREDVDCDRDVLESQVCPAVAAAMADDGVTAELVAPVGDLYDCDD